MLDPYKIPITSNKSEVNKNNYMTRLYCEHKSTIFQQNNNNNKKKTQRTIHNRNINSNKSTNNNQQSVVVYGMRANDDG